ncbi:hypothetical protein K3495_g96 [Podosphaera aphanis]|nr:hypothetical protein K3495_g96 [Podosphaera aphanis]
MYFILLSSVTLLFSLSAAQGTTYSIAAPTTPAIVPSSCGAQAVLDACISSTTAIAASCATTDYNCLCQKHTDILTCFNVCPNDPRRSATLTTQSSYCSNASLYSSATSSAISRSVSASSTSAISSYTYTSSSTTHSSTGTMSTSTEKEKPTSTSDSGASRVTAVGLALLGAGLVLI